MKSASPFNELRSTGISMSYNTIGRDTTPKKRKRRDIEDLQYGSIYTDQKEIDICLNCPYETCKTRCDRIVKYRRERRKNG